MNRFGRRQICTKVHAVFSCLAVLLLATEFAHAGVPTLTAPNISGTRTYGYSLTFSCTLTYQGAGISGQSVAFLVDGSQIGSGNTNSSGFAQYSSATVSAGNHSATCRYQSTTSSATSFTEARATPTISVSTSGTPSTFGNSVTFTATMSSGTSGAITFYNGGSSFCTGTLSGNIATCASNSLTAGAHTITAGYAGNANYNPVTSTGLTQNVNKATPAVFWSSPSPITYGTALSSAQLNATASTSGSFNYSPPSGTVLNGGTQTLSVAFSPTDTTDYNTSSGSVQITVNPVAPAFLNITSSGSPATYQTAVTFTATIASGPAGSINFYDGAALIGSSAISGTTATYTTSTLTPGTHLISASWPGNSNYGPISSSQVAETINGALLYSFIVPAGGYDGVGNLKNYTDSVTGSWTDSYDTLNRLMGGGSSKGSYPYYCWSYDAFGNRTTQENSSSAFSAGSGGPSPCQTTGGIDQNVWAQYNGTVNGTNNNQMSATSFNLDQGLSAGYDASGDVTNDGAYSYLYDGEGRICAVQNSAGGMTGYLYNAEGIRVAKGTLSAWNCSPSSWQQTTTDYVLGLGSEQLTEMSVSGTTITWAHTNVWSAGKLFATYESSGNKLHFYQNDPLGTRRSQTDPLGIQEQTCSSLPYGDAETCSPGPPTEHLFTGKERDIESKNDYFEARYYSWALGRFTSPDWSAKEEPVPYAKLEDPQTLNLYSYVRNNPLGATDADGHNPAVLAVVGAIACPECAVVAGTVAVGAAAVATVYHYRSEIIDGLTGSGPPASTGMYPTSMPTHMNSDTGTEQGRDAQGKFLPKEPGQAQPGADAEKAGLEALGATKNNETINGTRRDGTGTGSVAGVDAGQHVEIKSGENISNTKQLAGMAKTARAETGKPLVVGTTHPDAKVSKQVRNNPDIVLKDLSKR